MTVTCWLVSANGELLLNQDCHSLSLSLSCVSSKTIFYTYTKRMKKNVVHPEAFIIGFLSLQNFFFIIYMYIKTKQPSFSRIYCIVLLNAKCM